jgi:hypothetical protein
LEGVIAERNAIKHEVILLRQMEKLTAMQDREREEDFGGSVNVGGLNDDNAISIFIIVLHALERVEGE